MIIFTGCMLSPPGLHAAPLRDDVVAPPRGRLQDRKVLVLPRSVPVEERRQGTEPSRRFIMDLNTGLVKEHINEMDRRVGPVYVPPSVDEFRQGTENSQKTLVDIRSGRILKHVGEMERSMIMTPREPMEVPVPVQRRVGGWVRADVLPGSLPVEERRQGTEPSRRFLMDLNSGLVKEHVSEMDRRVAPVYTPSSVDEYRQGTENSQKTLVDIRSGRIIRPVGEMERSMKQIPQDERDRFQNVRLAEVEVRSIPVEERRQGTEPSRRFIMNLNTGLVKEHISEMDRRVAPVYTPSYVDEYRQGTENSQKTLVDIRSGRIIRPVGEMERSMKQISQDDRLVSAKAETHSEKECVGEVIDGHCYQFNPTLMTFSEAEVKYTPSQSYSLFSETNSCPNICVCVCVQSSCSVLSPRGHLASVTNGDLHSRLVSMVTKATKTPVLTWLGGVVKDKQSEWTDGSAWGYSDWMPGHPDTQTDKQACLEMFRIGETHTF
uniref:C-type lectin domain-containing protein n=1 Tax=Hucho hucho TaxID=62062 RepID=A0A4W5KE76_9TELE